MGVKSGWLKKKPELVERSALIGGRRVISAVTLYDNVVGFFRDKNGVLQCRPGARVVRFLMRKHLLSPVGWCPHCGMELFDLEQVESLVNQKAGIWSRTKYRTYRVSFIKNFPVVEDYVAVEVTFFSGYTGLTPDEIREYIKQGKLKYVKLLYRGIGNLGLLKRTRGVLIVPIALMERLRAEYEKRQKNSDWDKLHSIKNGDDPEPSHGSAEGNRKDIGLQNTSEKAL